MKDDLKVKFPTKFREGDVQKINDESVVSRNYEVASLEMYQKVRQESLAEQDKCKEEGVHPLKITAHRLHKLHLKRAITGVPITARLDATANIARTTTNNPPLLIDLLISDFSYANFHAILLAFNGISLSNYLNVAYEWIMHKIVEGDFQIYSAMVKIRMCFTHLMHTYADMCKRHNGKTKDNKQVKASKIILEILASMIKATDYNKVLQLWKQLVILMSNEFENDDVVRAISEVRDIIVELS